MYKKLKESGKAVSDKYTGTMDYFYLTPASLSLFRPLLPVFRKYVKGRLLDAGAGRLSYRFILDDYCDSYRSVDIETRKDDPIPQANELQSYSGNPFSREACLFTE